MSILLGFAPWVVYWVLVGNVPFAVSVLIALVIAVAALVIAQAAGTPGRTLEIGGAATFVVLTVLTLATSQSFAERWMQPLSIAGMFLATLTGALIRQPFAQRFVDADPPTEAVKREVFGRVAALLTWIWVAVFGGMTVSAWIPVIANADATILDTAAPLPVICYWVIPFALFGLGALVSPILVQRMTAGIDDLVRETTFVAPEEVTIDELYYLAQQHASREVGAGKEAYNVKVGRMGTPLVGDDSRMSWPSTYKVRERR